MATAQQHLAQFNVTVQQAKQFILDNLSNPKLIFDTCANFKVTNQMLAEIYGGVSPEDVQQFFNSVGLNGDQLNIFPDKPTLVPSEFNALSSLAAFNTETGILSTAILRAQIVQKTGQANYNKAFDPSTYAGAEDGVMTPAELGTSNLGTFNATQDNFESIYYGTIIKAYKSIDMGEINQINQFVLNNQAALQDPSDAVIDSFYKLLVSVFEDPANPPVLPDQALSQAVVLGTEMFVTLVGQGEDLNLFDGLITGWLPS